jgi:hypothetical protein
MNAPLSKLTLALALVAAGCDRPTSPVSASPASAAPQPASAAVASSAPPAATAPPPAVPAQAARTVVGFDGDQPGEAPHDFEAVVGEWHVADAKGTKALEVDGRHWRSGEPSAGLADQAKRLYGDRYAEFLDGVKAFAFFPFAVWKGEPPKGDVRISVRFYPEGGKIDQAAGIVFGVARDGTYWGVRANALEDNLLFFTVVKGKRNVLDNVRAVPTPSQQWHTLAVELRGKRLTAALDGQERFSKTLDAAPTGRIGLWSKADSQVLFDDFTVEALGTGP